MADIIKSTDKKVVFVKWFRHWRTGKVIRAEDFGKQAFAIPVK